MKELFREKARNIKIIISKSEEQDPYEKSTNEIPIMYLPVKAIVSDLTVSKIQWAMPGVLSDKAKEITIQQKDYSKLSLSSTIIVDGENYLGWKSNGKLQYRNTDDGKYIRCYIYLKKTN
jgi:hypothetical protein